MTIILLNWVLHKSGEHGFYKIVLQSWQVCIPSRDHIINDSGDGAVTCSP